MSSSTVARQIEEPEHHAEVKRIVTTLPSATEIVALLGLEDKLVGITHECDYPPSVRKKPTVLRSVFDSNRMTNREIDDSVMVRVENGEPIYEIDEALLRSLEPDLIITQELCEVCATPLRQVSTIIARLESTPQVLSLAPHHLGDVLCNILRVGEATGTLSRAKEIVSEFQKRIDVVKERCSVAQKLSAVCLEWIDPIYCSGHWMPEMVSYAGGIELLGRLGEPSMMVSWDQVLRADPDVILVSVCGYNVNKTLGELSTLTNRTDWENLHAVINGRVYVLDGASYFSRPGPRLIDGLEIIAFLLHPELFASYKLPRDSAYELSSGKFV